MIFELYRYCLSLSSKTSMKIVFLVKMGGRIGDYMLKQIFGLSLLITMPDTQELQPIYDSSEPRESFQLRQEKANIFSMPIFEILASLERKAKLVLCIVTLCILASFALLEGPNPSYKSHPLSRTQPKDTVNSNGRAFPVILETSSQDKEIILLSQSLRHNLNQIIEQNKLSLSQLKELQELILLKQNNLQRKHAFHNKRAQFFQQKSRFEYFGSLKLEKYNMQTGQQQLVRKYEAQKKQYEQMNYNYKFNLLSSQIPICAVVYATKTRKEYAPEYFLTSLSNQNYSNYKAVVVFDDRKDAGFDAWREGIHYSKLTRVQLIANQQKRGYWQSIKAVINGPCCADTEVIALMNGNDQLLGFHVFNVFNSVYQHQQANLAYSNFLEFHQQYNQIFRGFSNRYQQQQIANYAFRQAPIVFGSLLTFRKKLFNFVRDESVVFETEYGTEFPTQIALYLSLLQLSCGRIEYIPQYFYLFQGYKFKSSNGLLEQFLNKVRSLQRYKCYEYMFDKK